MKTTKVIQTIDHAARFRALLEYYALTPSKKYPLPTRIRRSDGKIETKKRTLDDWGQILGWGRSYLSKVLNNEDGFILKQPERFAEHAAKVLSEAFEIKIKPEDVWDLDE